MQQLSSLVDIGQVREELLQLLKRDGILYASADNPIQHRDGQGAPWMFYSWGATLTSRGAWLVAQYMLDRLKSFRSTQLATFGFTAMPILSACVLLGDGRYRALCVREDRKQYGSMRRIDGHPDRSKPVVVIDDSIASGTAVMKGIQALEAEGLRVEGCLGLMNFPHGGLEKLRSLGYRAETLFDIYKDLDMPQHKFEPIHLRCMPKEWGSSRVADGLHPAVAARRIAEMYLRDSAHPLPPHHLDREYDGRGGVFVSFRRRDSDYRVARDGYWHFNAEDSDPCRDLVLATVKTVQASAGQITLDTLSDLKLNATFFTPLEKIPPRQLNFWTHGIVVRSRSYDWKMGGALPNTQVFSNEIEQYRHARSTNGRVQEFEPHDIFRHSLDKCVEPGEAWPAYGFPYNPQEDWSRDESIGRALTRRVCDILLALQEKREPAGRGVSNKIIPVPVYTLSVTLYHRGLAGCGLAWDGTIDECLRRATETAYRDTRFLKTRVPVEEMAVSVSVLWEQEIIGNEGVEKGVGKMRRGLDSLSVMQGERKAMFLPLVPVYYNWDKYECGRQLLKKAGITTVPAIWATYQTATWLRRGNRQWKLSFCFPDRTEKPYEVKNWKPDCELMATYIFQQIEADGLPAYAYYPVSGQKTAVGTSARTAHAVWALDYAARVLRKPQWREASEKALRYCLDNVKSDTVSLPGRTAASITDAIVLGAVASCGKKELMRHAGAGALARRLHSLLQDDGRITERPGARGLELDHDFMPGAVLLALGRWAQASGERHLVENLDEHLRFARQRWEIAHPWGMLGWHTQGWAALYAATGRTDFAQFAMEMADWGLDWQSEYHGAFLADLHPNGLSFHTLFLAEGMADAWRVARQMGDEARARRYQQSCHQAYRFLDRLLIRAEDTFCMVDPAQAVGGVRGAVSVSDVRIDYVSHSLIALLKGLENEKLT